MKKRIVILILSLNFIFCFGQRKDFKRDDSLLLKISRNYYLNNNPIEFSRIATTVLNYDFQNQYPFYSLSNKRIGLNNKFNISFITLPKYGYVYVFTVNRMNNFKTLRIIKCDSLKDSDRSIISIIPKREHIEYISLWYSKNEINDFEKTLSSLKYTIGNFVHRSIYFLDEGLLSPNHNWNFTTNYTGVTFDNIINTADRFLIPIIIKLF